MFRIGIDLGGTKIEGVAMADDGNVAYQERVDTPTDYPKTLVAIKQMVEQLDRRVESRCPVGIGSPGAWIASRGAMKNCNNTCLIGKPFLPDLQRILQRPVRIANDADCFALSEAADGAGRGAGIVFGVILGTGVGAGWVVDGKLLQGPNGLSGEWGHSPLPEFKRDERTIENESKLIDRRCYCGRMNCVETFLSGPGLQRIHADLTGQEVDGETIANSTDSEATRTLYLHMLARALAGVINMVDPDVIVLGGGVSAMSAIYDRLPELLESYTFSTEGQTRIVPAQYGATSGVRGAAWLFSPSTATSAN